MELLRLLAEPSAWRGFGPAGAEEEPEAAEAVLGGDVMANVCCFCSLPTLRSVELVCRSWRAAAGSSLVWLEIWQRLRQKYGFLGALVGSPRAAGHELARSRVLGSRRLLQNRVLPALWLARQLRKLSVWSDRQGRYPLRALEYVWMITGMAGLCSCAITILTFVDTARRRGDPEMLLGTDRWLTQCRRIAVLYPCFIALTHLIVVVRGVSPWSPRLRLLGTLSTVLCVHMAAPAEGWVPHRSDLEILRRVAAELAMKARLPLAPAALVTLSLGTVEVARMLLQASLCRALPPEVVQHIKAEVSGAIDSTPLVARPGARGRVFSVVLVGVSVVTVCGSLLRWRPPRKA
eukprot:TRINITY_DN32175_c0_g1_i1.p1 TRINITY_DN32175_c0_g1~~TRINITY_DN32175_c0_g1_i1.p1  ORF type:complete len:348 (+),score=121.25 TRINITY_DN32175_c0_g1_i1:53-1096(+)